MLLIFRPWKWMSSKFHILSSVFLGPPFNHSFSLENHLPQPESCFSGNGRPILSKKCFKQPSRHYIFFHGQKKTSNHIGVFGSFLFFRLVFLTELLGKTREKVPTTSTATNQELVERHGKRLTLHFGEALEEVPCQHTWAMKSQGPLFTRDYTVQFYDGEFKKTIVSTKWLGTREESSLILVADLLSLGFFPCNPP